MASNTITRTHDLTFDGGPGEARERILAAIATVNGKVSEDGDTIVAKYGSQVLLRLVGGWFIPAASMPVKSTVTFEHAEGSTRAHVAVGDAMGVGVKAGTTKKFTAAVERVAAALAAA